MGAPIRFLFDNDFAAPPPEVVEVTDEELEEEVPTIELELHLEQMRTAEAAAYERGRQEGLRCVEAEAHQQVALEARRLAEAAETMVSAVDGDLRRIEADATVLCAAIAKKIAGFALGHFPQGQILALIEECLAPLRDVRHLAIRVNETDVEKLKEPIESLAAKNGFEGRLLILGEPETRPGDCRIEWADGGVLFERDAILDSVDAAIRTYLGPAEHKYDIVPGLDDSAEGYSGPPGVESAAGQELASDRVRDDEVSDESPQAEPDFAHSATGTMPAVDQVEVGTRLDNMPGEDMDQIDLGVDTVRPGDKSDE